MKKNIFDLIFIVISAAILLLINHYGYLEKYMAFSLVPILIAYFLGQFSEKAFGSRKKGKIDTDEKIFNGVK